ncbi:MAG: YfhO family protein, partial [Bacteroidales bacterium]|nr:YfhO family protein [Bacteroidales bacterium]
LFPGVFFDFISQAESQQFAQFQSQGNAAQINAYLAELETARMSIFKADAIRSFLFILIAGALLWLYSFNKLKSHVLIALVSVLILIDMAAVANRYLDSEDFVRKSKMTKPYQASIADQEIIKDNDPNFRVFNLAVNSFNDASTSYFHKSIGGYHGAKLRRYQELINHAILPERQMLVEAFQSETPMLEVDKTLPKLSVLNMLNTKYFILDPAQPPLQNRYALGNAWFVNSLNVVENADEEIKAVQDFNPARTAIVDKRFEEVISSLDLNDTLQYGTIRLTNYKPNKLTYLSKANEDAFAVFSEIYYSEGWNAYIDGEKAAHARVNYVLRGMRVPAGEHQIVFAFEPAVYRTGETISLISSIVLILLIIGGAYLGFKEGRIFRA